MSRSIAELSSAFTVGLQTQFDRYYDVATRQADPRLGFLANLGITSQGQYELYHIWNANPRFGRWREGSGIPSKGFAGVQFQVENLEWGREIVVHKNAVADDRTRMFMEGVRKLAEDKPRLVERLLFQVLKGGTDVDGIDILPNAADGQALFSTTGADGNPRYGVTNGNLLTASGTSVTNRRDDYYSGLAQFLQMQDTEGRPLITEQMLEQAGILIIFPASQLETFVQAFVQKLGALVSSASAPSNMILDEGRKLILWPTQFLSGTSFYMQLMIPEKALFLQDREPVQVEVADLNNSDRARGRGELGFQAHTRLGIGVTHPFSLIKIN